MLFACGFQLLHDYAIRVPSTLQHIEENFEKAIKPLASMLNQNVPKDDLEKLKLIQSFDDYFRQEDNHFPCLQLWDVSRSINISGIEIK